MNKRIIFHAQDDETPAWDVYLDFKRIGTVVTEAVDTRFELAYLVFIRSDDDDFNGIFNSRKKAVEAIETACADRLAVPPVKQELRIERDEEHWRLGRSLDVYVGELRLGGFWLKTDSRYSDYVGMIEADWLWGVGGFHGWLNPPRFASEADVLHYIKTKYGKELGL